MASPDSYVLRVTAGTSYDADSHIEVPVNVPEPLVLNGESADISLNVRIDNYRRGLPKGSPETSEYFTSEPHTTNRDTYSISLWFTPKHPKESPEKYVCPEAPSSEEQGTGVGQPHSRAAGISGHDLQWGNDFDQPLRDHLPPGFNTALRIVKWWIDPGLQGDPYADKPYLFGSALSSFNTVYVAGSTADALDNRGLWFEEGGDAAGMAQRKTAGLVEDPTMDNKSKSAARQKWALSDKAKTQWKWEYGINYGLDFFNGYLDFSEFALRLPGFQLPVLKYWDGQSLRYVLRHRTTGEVYLVVVFSIRLKEEDKNCDGPASQKAEDKGEAQPGTRCGNEGKRTGKDRALDGMAINVGVGQSQIDVCPSDVD